jgi:hypothetical protein
MKQNQMNRRDAEAQGSAGVAQAFLLLCRNHYLLSHDDLKVVGGAPTTALAGERAPTKFHRLQMLEGDIHNVYASRIVKRGFRRGAVLRRTRKIGPLLETNSGERRPAARLAQQIPERMANLSAQNVAGRKNQSSLAGLGRWARVPGDKSPGYYHRVALQRKEWVR